MEVERFGNVRPGRKGGPSEVSDVREPLVDLFEEGDHVQVVAELPGVEERDVRYEVTEGRLVLQAERGARRYRKELPLPKGVDAGRAQAAFRNGVFELRLPCGGS